MAQIEDSTQYFDDIYEKNVDNTFETEDVERNRLDISKSESSSRSKREMRSKIGQNSRS